MPTAASQTPPEAPRLTSSDDAPTSAGTPQPGPRPWGDWEDEVVEPPFKALTREEVQALVAKQPAISPWQVIAAQAAVGSTVAALAWWLVGESSFWSALYGAAVVVLPGALMAFGVTRRLSGQPPNAFALGFLVWELVKVGASVVMLVIAPWVLEPTIWPALLVGLVVALKVYWVALLRWRRPLGK